MQIRAEILTCITLMQLHAYQVPPSDHMSRCWCGLPKTQIMFTLLLDESNDSSSLAKWGLAMYHIKDC